MARIYAFPASTMPIYHHALKESSRERKVYRVFDAKTIDEHADWFFPVANLIFRETIQEFGKRKGKALQYPGHMLDHHERVFYNSVIVSNINKSTIREEDVKKAAKTAYAALMHDIFKGETEEGRDIHSRLAAEFAADIIYGFPIDEDIKRDVVSTVESHGNYEIRAGTFNRIMDRLYRLSRKDAELKRTFMIADTLDRINEDRVFLKLYSALKEGVDIEDVARSKWFFCHREGEDIFRDVKHDERPYVLRIFDEDVRTTLRKFKRKLYAGVLEEDVKHRKKRIIDKNNDYENMEWSLKSGYDDYAENMSVYFLE